MGQIKINEVSMWNRYSSDCFPMVKEKTEASSNPKCFSVSKHSAYTSWSRERTFEKQHATIYYLPDAFSHVALQCFRTLTISPTPWHTPLGVYDFSLVFHEHSSASPLVHSTHLLPLGRSEQGCSRTSKGASI